MENECFWTVVLEKTLESPLDSKEIKSVNPDGNKSWIFLGRTDVEAPIFWPPDVKSWHNGKDPNAGKDWGQEEKRVTEAEMVGWHHQLNGHEFEQTQGDMKDREAWCAVVHGVTKSWTWLSNWTTMTATFLECYLYFINAVIFFVDYIFSPITLLLSSLYETWEHLDWLLLLFSHSVMSNSLQPHGLQRSRLPYPSLSPRVFSNSCPLSWQGHPTISSSVAPFSSCPQSFPASESFLLSQLFASGGQSIDIEGLIEGKLFIQPQIKSFQIIDQQIISLPPTLWRVDLPEFLI